LANDLALQKRIEPAGHSFCWKTISKYVLECGGIAFIASGAAILYAPLLLNLVIVTPIYVHNLHDLGLRLLPVTTVVVIMGLVGYKRAMSMAECNPRFIKQDALK
jgi:hypothetical protein